MHLKKFETSQYRPKQCFEWRVRVYCKNKLLQEEAFEAFQRYASKNGGLSYFVGSDHEFGSERAETKSEISGLATKRMKL